MVTPSSVQGFGASPWIPALARGPSRVWVQTLYPQERPGAAHQGPGAIRQERIRRGHHPRRRPEGEPRE
eukprot:8603869-Lingulodinium_polyedra.AAC.1